MYGYSCLIIVWQLLVNQVRRPGKSNISLIVNMPFHDSVMFRVFPESKELLSSVRSSFCINSGLSTSHGSSHLELKNVHFTTHFINSCKLEIGFSELIYIK